MIEQEGTRWSGSLIGYAPNGDGIYLTCKHGYNAKKPVSLLLNKVAHGDGRVVAFAKETDLALVQGRVSSKMRPVRLAEESPYTSDEIVLVGHPREQFVRKTTTLKDRAFVYIWKLKEYRVYPEANGFSEPCLISEGSSQPGFSGGAMLQGGKLCGVIVSSTGNEHDAVAIPAETIVKFVKQNEKLFWRSVVP